MVRMDLLLNPGSPPPSPSPSDCAESPTEPQESSFLGLPLRVELPPIVTNQQSSLTSKAVLPTPTNQRLLDVSNTPHSPSNAPAVKRHKPELPALRLLLDGGSDNQRDDAPHEIFSGHAFWGKVPSLNPPAASPSDVSDLGTSSVLSKSSACKPISTLRGSSIVQDQGKALLLPSLPLIAAVAAAKTVPVNVTASRVEEESSSLETETTMAASTTPSGKNGKKKKISICKEDGCSSQALSKNLCMKHGGGPRCSVPDCNNGAKLKNLCFQHGGSTICLAPSCSSKAKRFGYCWSHGGGRICAEDDCNKVAAQGGMCWAHGGGNRCKLPGCTKRSYKQNGYYCKRHAEVSADY